MASNPLQDGLRLEPTPGPTTLVIFGATGDLTRRKLLPALYHLSRGQRLPARFSIVGVARDPLGEDGFRAQFRESLRDFAGAQDEDPVARSLAQRMHYVGGDFSEPSLFQRVSATLQEINSDGGALFYLAIPPTAYTNVIEQLGAAGLSKEASAERWRRVIVEKPFGTDLASARELNQIIHRHFDEEQVFRIDHYLGKETVQNLHGVPVCQRDVRADLEPALHRSRPDHGGRDRRGRTRASYYEGAGALRDMVQNHLMQLLSLVAMEPPIAFTAESVRDRKLDALLSVQPLIDESSDATHVVRAQYAAGWVGGGEVPAYRTEPRVSPESTTETFVALRMQLDSWRWAGVPFYLRTGKRMPKRTTEIAIQLRRPPLEIFKRVSPTSVAPNLLIINVQPDEGISVRFEAKLPSTRMQLAPVMMNFRYGTAFGGVVPEAYETLLLDAMLGDPTLFARHDFVEASWALITPVHEHWRREQARTIAAYEAGEWGPAEADAMIARDGHRWRTL